MAKRPFNGSPTVDGYYTTFDSSEVHRIEESSDDQGGGGSSDFSTAQVTVINANSDGGRSFTLPNSDDLDGTPFSPASLGDVYVAKNETITVTAILYKGKTMTPNAPNYSVTGNASISNGLLVITGDCTITIS